MILPPPSVVELAKIVYNLAHDLWLWLTGLDGWPPWG